ncbi:type II toxin -antitoxin system TacA 1-like antitoxin [Clostridium sp.]|uniref:type II toxin -antitoxin system TacA 1-like antitoxin n=1 Tax=Clostridium sp. TaxID=1506 RepID=UPI002FCACBDE
MHFVMIAIHYMDGGNVMREKNSQIQIRISIEDKKKLKVLAALKGLNLSEYVMFLAMKDIAENEFLNNIPQK